MRCLRKIHIMFGKQQILTMTGFTKTILKKLESPILVPLKSNDVKVVGVEGGVPTEMVQRCIGRMCNWVGLAGEVVRAEFPDFAVSACLKVLDISAATHTNMSDEEHQSTIESLTRLSNSLELDPKRVVD